MQNFGFNDLVNDWGGFEDFIAKLHETGEVEVDHNVKLIGKSGATRQFDVIVRHKQGIYEHLVIVECKYWKQKVKREQIDALATKVRDHGASKGVIFTTLGYQRGAKIAAKHEHIEIFKIRGLTDKEWGNPGRVIDFYMHIYNRTIFNFTIPPALIIGIPKKPIDSLTLNISIGIKPEENSFTQTLNQDGSKGMSLEERLVEASQKCLKKFTEKPFLFNHGEESTFYMQGHVRCEPPNGFIIPRPGGILHIPIIEFDLGIKVLQSRFIFDRMSLYQFACIVENSINNTIHIASRRKETKETKLNVREENPQDEKSLINGSLFQIYLRTFFDPAEILNLEPKPIKVG